MIVFFAYFVYKLLVIEAMSTFLGILKRDSGLKRGRNHDDLIAEQEAGLLKDSQNNASIIKQSNSSSVENAATNCTSSTEQPFSQLRNDEAGAFINMGEPDQMEYQCYRKSMVKTFLTYFCVVLTGGLLRLVFHWVPHWYLRARCRMASDVWEADYLLIKELYNDKHAIYHVKPLHHLTVQSAIDKRRSSDADVDVDTSYIKTFSVHFGGGEFAQLEKILMFKCKKVTYLYSTEVGGFVKLRGLDYKVNSEALHMNKGLTKAEQYIRRLIYDRNEIVVKESSIPELLFLEVLNPFYIFQLFSFLLWFLDNYYYYAAAILLMSVFGITMTVIQTRRNQRNLKSTVHSCDVATVLRRLPSSHLHSSSLSLASTTSTSLSLTHTSELISTDLLVPGDILELPPNGCVMQCDAVLLTGTCIVNESMLTGESVPVTKTALPSLREVRYDGKEHGRHTLFCGTQIIQTRYFGGEKVLAVVVKTGFSTAKGGLVRSILYPPPVDFRFEKDSYRFVALLACIAGIGFIYTIVTKVLRGVDAADIIVEALDLITIVVPPALPAAMTVGRLYAQTRLRKEQIYCISPRSINVSGSIDCVCFDKTGTLTEDGLDLLCVVPVKNGAFSRRVTEVDTAMSDYDTFLYGLVCCHSLTIIEKQITGDPLDLKMFESTKWSMEEPEISDNTKFDMLYPTVFKPAQTQNVATLDESVEPIEFQIGKIREFPFSSSSQRMGVIIRKLGGQHFEYYCKGSPEMILNFASPHSIPEDFHTVLERYTQQGYRVIALAHRELSLSYAKVQKVRRETIEVDMTLLGFIVLENRLKADTSPCIKKLNQANIRVIMVTGDNILTAVSVARDCGILTQGQSVITVNSFASIDPSLPPQLYFSLTSTKTVAAHSLSRADTKLADVSVMTNSLSVRSGDTFDTQVVVTMVEELEERERYNGGKKMNGEMVKIEFDRPESLLYNNYRFAITGKVWAIVKEHYPDLIPRLVTRGSIFARMAPDQKQQLVEELQTLGYYVAMCGDGANDCGALKAAHTGISLSEAESSVASPFTSKIGNISCVLNVIKEGRAALVTSFGIFKYMAAYSLCQFISVLILYSIESNLTDIEFLYIDLFIISIFAFFFGRTQAYKGNLVKETPLNSLISLSPVVSLLLQITLVIIFQVLSFEHLKSQDWYEPFNATSKEEKDDVSCVENYTIFTISGFQYVILAIVFSKGAPYRESIFSNYGFIISAILLTAFSIYIALEPAQFLIDIFELILPSDFNFRMYLLLYAGIHCVCAIILELFVIDHIVFKRLRFKFHNVAKSKRKFLLIERDLAADVSWPTLGGGGSDGGANSGLTSPGMGAAGGGGDVEIVRVERFGKNHVLNDLCGSGKVGDEGVGGGSGGSVNDIVSLQDLTSDSADVYQSADTLDDIASPPTTPIYLNNNNNNNIASSDASFQTARTAPHSIPNTPRIKLATLDHSTSKNLPGSLPNSPKLQCNGGLVNDGINGQSSFDFGMYDSSCSFHHDLLMGRSVDRSCSLDMCQKSIELHNLDQPSPSSR